MKKQSGFTLIELMVVMAIIAILATAGLSAYTGYLKKARDTTRIADIATINTIILGSMASTGLPPTTVSALQTKIQDANNGASILDPIDGKSTCLNSYTGSTSTAPCKYKYTLCDAGVGFAIATSFESTANQGLLAADAIGTVAADAQTNTVASNVDGLYSIGSCNAYCDTTTSCGTSVAHAYTDII